jgi:PTS system mannose-specific IIA component
MTAIIVITHGHFGRELLQTAQDIVGRQENVAALSVTQESGISQLSDAISKTCGQFSDSTEVLFLVDMLGGTPCNTAIMKSKDKSWEIVTGVNLYMLISAFRHRGDLDVKALSEKIAADGKRAITLPRDMLKKAL